MSRLVYFCISFRGLAELLMLCAMDYETLVAEIYKKPALWDGNHPDHHYRQIVERHWEEIGEKTGLSKIDCRKKWKYFKDQYRKELRKELYSSSGFESQWPLYRHMSFLRKQMERSISENAQQLPNSSSTNGGDPSTFKNEKENSNDNSLFLQPNLCNLPVDQKSPYIELKMNKRRKLDDTTERFLQLEERKAAMLSKLSAEHDEEENSDDILFFKSLLPFMKKFGDVQKLKVRSKIQCVILSELEDTSTATMPSQVHQNSMEQNSQPQYSEYEVKFEMN